MYKKSDRDKISFCCFILYKSWKRPLLRHVSAQPAWVTPINLRIRPSCLWWHDFQTLTYHSFAFRKLSYNNKWVDIKIIIYKGYPSSIFLIAPWEVYDLSLCEDGVRCRLGRYGRYTVGTTERSGCIHVWVGLGDKREMPAVYMCKYMWGIKYARGYEGWVHVYTWGIKYARGYEGCVHILLVFSVMPFKIDQNKNQNHSFIHWEKKEGEYAKTLAKFQVTAIFLMQDMRRNVLPKFIEICMEPPCWCPCGWALTWRPETNKNICHWVLLQKREFISRGTQKHQHIIFSNTGTVQIAKFPEISPDMAVKQMPRHAKV